MRRQGFLRHVCFRALCQALFAVLPLSVASADNGLVYRLDGVDNRIYLLGSIHVLRAEDYPLPKTFRTAYADAEILVMELDMDAFDPLAAQQLMLIRGLATDGRTLRTIMGEPDYLKARQRIDALGLDHRFLDSLEPWFAALTVVTLQFSRLGFDPNQGIEAYFTKSAARDGKDIIGLETLNEQLDLFDSLPDRTQSEFLLMSLEEATNMERDLTDMIDAWKSGDEKTLEREMLKEFSRSRSLYRKLVVDRNTAWSRFISNLSRNSSDDHLVVVGALHLVGADSLVVMLERAGHDVVRVTATPDNR